MNKCSTCFLLSMGAFAVTGFYLLGQLLIETMNDWSFQMAGAATRVMPLAFGTLPIAEQNFFRSYSATPIHRDVLSFVASPSMLVCCCLLVCVTGFALWLQHRNETLLLGRFQTEIGQMRGNFANEKYDKLATEETGYGAGFDTAYDSGLAPSVR